MLLQLLAPQATLTLGLLIAALVAPGDAKPGASAAASSSLSLAVAFALAKRRLPVGVGGSSNYSGNNSNSSSGAGARSAAAPSTLKTTALRGTAASLLATLLQRTCPAVAAGGGVIHPTAAITATSSRPYISVRQRYWYHTHGRPAPPGTLLAEDESGREIAEGSGPARIYATRQALVIVQPPRSPPVWVLPFAHVKGGEVTLLESDVSGGGSAFLTLRLAEGADLGGRSGDPTFTRIALSHVAQLTSLLKAGGLAVATHVEFVEEGEEA